MSRHCFTYGSLMCPDIMARVCGALHTGAIARLREYIRKPVQSEDYPGIVPSTGNEVTGVLYRDLPDTAWPRLDAFEGEMYRRMQVQVELADGQTLTAWAYVIQPEFTHQLTDGIWDFEAFKRQGKDRFEARYMGFSTLPD